MSMIFENWYFLVLIGTQHSGALNTTKKRQSEIIFTLILALWALLHHKINNH